MSEKRGKKVTFEDELAKLESIVDALESGEVTLAELVVRYEDGMKHLRTCRAFLDDAELRLEQIKSGPAGDKTEPLKLPESEA